MKIHILLLNDLRLQILQNLAIFNNLIVFYLNLQKLYRLYNNQQGSVSRNKLLLQKRILHTQEVLKIKKIKLKKGRVKFSFHSLFYGNLLLFQSFEVELIGDTKKKEARELLENELNPTR